MALNLDPSPAITHFEVVTPAKLLVMATMNRLYAAIVASLRQLVANH